MTLSPNISIIIPTYNSATTIRACVESISIQTYMDYEVIICDGLSIDDTINIVSTFFTADKNRLVVVSEGDMGIYDAMNKGIMRSRGNWLFFMGSDDELHDASVLARMDAYLRRDLDIVYGSALWVSSTKPERIYDRVFKPENLLRENICHQAIFYRKKLFSDFGSYQIKYKMYADWIFNMKVFPKVKSLHVELVVTRYNCEGASSKTADLEFDRDRTKLGIRYLSPRMNDDFFNYRVRSTAAAFREFLSSGQVRAAARAFSILLWQGFSRSFALVSKMRRWLYVRGNVA